MAQATTILGAVVPLLEKLVWPVFLWFAWRRKDVQRHIRTILKNHRLSKLSLPGAKIEFAAGAMKRLPEDEAEKELILDGPSRRLKLRARPR